MTEDVKEREAVEKDIAKIEEAELCAYMDLENANGEGPDDDDRLAYLKKRYGQVKAEYKDLLLQKEEADARKRDDIVNQIHVALRENYRARKWVVRQLRAGGGTVCDRFVST